MRKLLTILAMLMGIIALHGNGGSNIILVEENHCRQNGIWIKTVETPEDVQRYEYWIITEEGHWSILHEQNEETYIPKLKNGTYQITRYAFLTTGGFSKSNTCKANVQDCEGPAASNCETQLQELEDIIRQQRLQIQDLTLNYDSRTGGKNPNNDLSLYPNPATDYINLDNPHGNQYTLTVSDATGRQTYRENFNDRFIEIPLTEGMNYITLIDEQGGRITKQILSD